MGNLLRVRLDALLEALEHGLVERRRQVRLALLAALAGEHTLLIGPPGTAKSELARRLHLAFRDAQYFERLLTRFSVPEELFGPLSISALEQDRYERQTAGYLPQASIAFIDEVFKANSAILNALLTLLNERKFDNGAGRQDCPLTASCCACRWPRSVPTASASSWPSKRAPNCRQPRRSTAPTATRSRARHARWSSPTSCPASSRSCARTWPGNRSTSPTGGG